MKNVQKQKRANKSLPFFFREEFKVCLVIILTSVALLITTFTFDIVPPILNRGIQPATFPKALLILIIVMSLLIYYLAIKNPWKVEKKLPHPEDGWKIKNRTYFIKGKAKRSLSRSIKSSGIYYFDEEKGYERELKYCEYQQTCFVDEMQGDQRLSHIIFRPLPGT